MCACICVWTCFIFDVCIGDRNVFVYHYCICMRLSPLCTGGSSSNSGSGSEVNGFKYDIIGKRVDGVKRVNEYRICKSKRLNNIHIQHTTLYRARTHTYMTEPHTHTLTDQKKKQKTKKEID